MFPPFDLQPPENRHSHTVRLLVHGIFNTWDVQYTVFSIHGILSTWLLSCHLRPRRTVKLRFFGRKTVFLNLSTGVKLYVLSPKPWLKNPGQKSCQKSGQKSGPKSRHADHVSGIVVIIIIMIKV